MDTRSRVEKQDLICDFLMALDDHIYRKAREANNPGMYLDDSTREALQGHLERILDID